MTHDESRITWDNVWMGFAELVSKRSADPKYKVGAVIISDDNTQVMSIGYNGDHKGGPNLRDSMESGGSGFIHAEINALIKCDFNLHKRKKMYLTLSPCLLCAKAIVNADVSEVCYSQEYSAEGLELLRHNGIVVRKIE